MEGGLTMEVGEPLKDLEEDAKPQGEQEYAIEECAEHLGTLPSEGECFRRGVSV